MAPGTQDEPVAVDVGAQEGSAQGAAESDRVHSSPSSAFAALSLADFAAASGSSSPAHLQEMEAATTLVNALDEARKRPKKLIRSTGHIVPSSSKRHHHLLSWKVAEFAYRKSSSVGAELPTLARGLFTERVETPPGEPPRHRIVVRGYDKFFNLGEMPWTKPASIAAHTTGPYVMTFKENGCIIFVSALSEAQLLVTSKHSLGSIEGTETTHAQMGEQWLQRHLSSVGKSTQQLAAELWRRNETAAFELCDDTFEEHVLEYSKERSGLHLHGLNANAVQFRTRSMPDVDAFASTWGFIRTRWIEMQTLDEVQRVTAEIEKTGAWEGEPIEGFVIRTHMPSPPVHAADVVSPPYAPGQAWFYKVKFDEPYLMYRDWRELTRKMDSQKSAWEKQVPQAAPSTPPAPAPSSGASEPQSKAAKKREKKRADQQAAQAVSALRLEAQNAGLVPPEMPQPKSKRPETRLFIQWCYDRLYGCAERKVKPQPALFANLGQNKGIIAMRNAFVQYMATDEGRAQLVRFGGASGSAEEQAQNDRPFTKTVLAPIAVPGCGKTILAVALRYLFPSLVGHVQSDDFKAKKGFLGSVEKDLRAHAAVENYVLFADKNNHLFQHRDELVELCTRLSLPPSGDKRQAPHVGRIRTVALAYTLDALPLNTLHRVCAARIEQRGANHQTLRADPSPHSMAGLKSHEQVLWRFLEGLQPFASSLGGEGAQGWGDAKFDHVVPLPVASTPRENLDAVLQTLCPMLGWALPDAARVDEALAHASAWKVAPKPHAKDGATASNEPEGEAPAVPRYFGVAVELDIKTLLDRFFAAQTQASGFAEARAFYTTVRDGGRLNLRPHITLVHSSNLSSATGANDATADAKWAFCTDLVTANAERGPREYVFELTLGALLYERESLLTFPITDIRLGVSTESEKVTAPETEREKEAAHTFRTLTHDWTPHITIATRSNDVRPFRANHVVSTHLAHTPAEPPIFALPLPHTVTVQGRIFGMS